MFLTRNRGYCIARRPVSHNIYSPCRDMSKFCEKLAETAQCFIRLAAAASFENHRNGILLKKGSDSVRCI